LAVLLFSAGHSHSYHASGQTHRHHLYPVALLLLLPSADRKKIPAAMPMFDLYSAELVEVDEPMWHMARFLPSVK